MLAKYIRDKGLQQGMQQGVQQGMQQGITRKAKEDIIRILELRFGKVPPEIREKINQTNDPEILNGYLEQGVQIKSLDQF